MDLHGLQLGARPRYKFGPEHSPIGASIAATRRNPRPSMRGGCQAVKNWGLSISPSYLEVEAIRDASLDFYYEWQRRCRSSR